MKRKGINDTGRVQERRLRKKQKKNKEKENRETGHHCRDFPQIRETKRVEEQVRNKRKEKNVLRNLIVSSNQEMKRTSGREGRRVG